LDPDGLRLAIDPGTVFGKYGQSLIGGKPDADTIQDIKRSLLKLIQLLIGEVLEPICRTEWFEGWSLTVHLLYSLPL